MNFDRIMRRPPDQVIGPPTRPYMLRWHLLRTRLGGVYLHQFMRDDDDRALHDHPWPSLSYVVSGVTGEFYARPGFDPADRERHVYREHCAGQWVWRSARFSHRVVLPKGPAVTLFLFGPRVRQWGFWCPQGWRHWKEYAKPGARGEIGRGCE